MQWSDRLFGRAFAMVAGAVVLALGLHEGDHLLTMLGIAVLGTGVIGFVPLWLAMRTHVGGSMPRAGRFMVVLRLVAPCVFIVLGAVAATLATHDVLLRLIAVGLAVASAALLAWAIVGTRGSVAESQDDVGVDLEDAEPDLASGALLTD